MKQSLSHTVWECKYHIVWVPKRRRKVIYGQLRRDVGQIIRKLCEYKGVGLVEGKACIDHVHLCLSIPPKYAVATIVGYLKGKSAIAIARQFDGRQRNFSGERFWARGYAVSTVGFELDKIRDYIRHQERQEQEEDEGRF